MPPNTSEGNDSDTPQPELPVLDNPLEMETIRKDFGGGESRENKLGGQQD